MYICVALICRFIINFSFFLQRTPNIQIDINPSTHHSNASILYQPFSWLRLEANGQASIRELFRYVVSIDYIGSSSTTNVTMSNLGKNTGKFDLSYMESINPRWAFGTQLSGDATAWHTGLSVRYSLDNLTYAMTLSARTIDLSHWTQINDRLQLATKYEYDYKAKKFLSCIIYQYEFPNACIRGQFGSDLSVGSTYNL